MAGKKNRGTYFWAGYTDLMTSLFFVMLVLYVFTYYLLQKQKKGFETDAQKYREILHVEKSVEALEETAFFEYNNEEKVLLMTRRIQFDKSSAIIPFSDKAYLTDVGNAIKDLINKARVDKIKSNNENILKFVLIIEGTASKDRAGDDFNYLLSYQRAYSLYKYWKDEAEIKFDPAFTQLLISGSGIRGTLREEDEVKNQRFIIQIIPKITAKKN